MDMPGLPDEHDAGHEPTSDWIGVVDGAYSFHGQDGINEPGLGGAYEIQNTKRKTGSRTYRGGARWERACRDRGGRW